MQNRRTLAPCGLVLGLCTRELLLMPSSATDSPPVIWLNGAIELACGELAEILILAALGELAVAGGGVGSRGCVGGFGGAAPAATAYRMGGFTGFAGPFGKPAFSA